MKTLNYISRIIAYEGNIANLFEAKVIQGERPSAPGLARLFAESVSLGLVSNSAARKD